MKNIKKILVILVGILLLTSCDKSDFNLTKIKVTASILPIASITNYIWWGNVSVDTVIWKWVSPHDFTLKPQDIKNITKADLVVYTWFSLDNFIEKNLKEDQKRVMMREIAVKREVNNWHSHKHEWEENILDNGNSEFDEKKIYDPHVWLSPLNAKLLAREIRDKLTQIDPENKEYYQNNYYDFEGELNKIITDFYAFQEDKKQNYFIVLHDWFEYLFYEVWVDKAKQLVIRKIPWVEITIKDFLNIKKIINRDKSKKVWAIFKEPEVDSKAISSLEENYNIPVKSMSPLWESSDKNSYINNIKDNLEVLKTIYQEENAQENNSDKK